MTELDRFASAATEQPPRVAPYTFVGIPNKIVLSPIETPDHSRPLLKAVSGSIDISMKAETPLLVGGGDLSSEQPNSDTPMSLGSDTYLIPGSSLKGMVRSVMESACAARLSFIDDYVGYSRDFKDPAWQAVVPNLQTHVQTGGWLFRKPDNGFALVVAEEATPIPLRDIAAAVGVTVSDWHLEHLHGRLNKIQSAGLHGVRSLSAFGLSKPVRLVVAGQTAETGRSGQNPKQREFAFVWPKKPIESVVMLDTIHVERFLASLHRDGNAHAGAPAANYDALITTGGITGFEAVPEETRPTLEDQFAEPEIYGLPVFWCNQNGRSPDKPEPDPILSLTAWLRVPNRTTLKNVAARSQTETDPGRLDMVQALLGWAPAEDDLPRPAERTSTQRAWRSRVKFGFAVSENAQCEVESRIWAAPQPRPSFWPYYLRARTPDSKHPLSYNGDTVLAGRKRYPARGAASQLPRDQDAAQSNTQGEARRESTITFLKPGAEFKATIRLHNLALVELGALIWALTYGDINGNLGFRHMLGRGKPHGFGQIRLQIEPTSQIAEIRGGENVMLETALDAFRAHMTAELDGDFEQLEHIRVLKGTAHAETGKTLAPNLVFSRIDDKPGEGQDQKILNAYSKMKRDGFNLKNTKASNAAATGLPQYPGPKRDPES